MKGLSETMFIIVAVIVILIVALVVLTIFGQLPGQVGTIAEARNNCQLTAEGACASTGTLPVTWDLPSQRTDQGLVACRDILAGCSCSDRVFSC